MRSFTLISVLVLGFAAAPTPADASGVRMFVRHEVADYATWRKAYEGFDATRRTMGVTAQAVYRSAENPNDVTATHDFKTVDKAKAFAVSAQLKTAMQSAGVKGPPQIWFTTGTPGRSGKASHLRMYIRHEVADYAAWRKAYDGFAATQKKMGVTAQAVYQSTDQPNDVTIYHDFTTLEQAKAFTASSELKTAMENAGVKGAPQIWYTTGATK